MDLIVDHFTIYKKQRLSNENGSTSIFQALDTRLSKICICVIYNIEPNVNVNPAEVNSKISTIQSWGFQGYLTIIYHKVTQNAIFVFFDLPGEARSLAELLQSGYSISNVDAVRIGSLMLDSYQMFYRNNDPHQDIEFDHLMYSRNTQSPQDIRFYLLPPIPWATGVRVLNTLTINFKPLESLERIHIDTKDLITLHKKFVWKFGLIMHLIINKRLPFSFEDANPRDNTIGKETVDKFARYIRNSNLSNWVTGKSALTEVLQRCLEFSLDKRIDFLTLYSSFEKLRMTFLPQTSQLDKTASFGLNSSTYTQQENFPIQHQETRTKSHTLNAGLYSLVGSMAPNLANQHTPQQNAGFSTAGNPYLVGFGITTGLSDESIRRSSSANSTYG
jgi:hypothetical protein